MEDKKIIKAFSLQPATVELLKRLEAGYYVNISKFVDTAITEKAEATLNSIYDKGAEENEV